MTCQVRMRGMSWAPLRRRVICGELTRRALGPFLMIMLGMCAAANADCIDEAAARHEIDASLMRAIAYFESGMNPKALHQNANGTVDIGLMQINSVHLPELAKYGIDRATLEDACVNAEVGAAMLHQRIAQFGATWLAVGEYHSHTATLRATYAKSIHDVYHRRSWTLRKKTRASVPAGRRVDMANEGTGGH